ncbi:MFS transporter [Magnetospirillum molischianum]|uniref:Major facilitator superfamily MFS_1 n=1 Tax=Magnetospirillum molischianum DSM 120 TaxID=1150626 RepID=H8FS55_MAGML|nr:MFS transporter [Magnetospirillum molischianum]CCG41193.1 Major facilitator superfamily MFS_1 [Magnetospirillum molischianum DSM 120]
MERKTAPATWWLLTSLYTTQYLGLGFLVVALVAILRDQGASLDQIGLIYMLGLVWPLKFLWAPLVDRIRFGRWGHYRVWLLLTQTGLALTLATMGRFDVIDDFWTIYLLGLAVAVLSASQDIAVDGLACRLLAPSDRGFGNGIQIAGNLFGNMLGGGVVLITYPYLGWQGSLLLLAAGTSVSLLQLLWYREPPWALVPNLGANLFRSVATFWHQPGGRLWLLLLLLYPIGSSLAYALIIPILVDAGWEMDRIGFAVNVLGSLAGMAAAMATGWLLPRLGRRRGMIWAALLQILGIAALALPVFGLTGTVSVTTAVLLYFLLYNPAATVLSTLMMDHASPDRPATDYTVQYSLNMLFAMATMSGAAALAGQIGYGGVLGLAVLAGLLAALLSLRYRPDGGTTTITAPVSAAAVGEAR